MPMEITNKDGKTIGRVGDSPSEDKFLKDGEMVDYSEAATDAEEKAKKKKAKKDDKEKDDKEKNKTDQ